MTITAKKLLLAAPVGLGLAAFMILNQKKFGKKPSGERRKRILRSPNYKNGRFDNQNPTPQLAEDTSMPEVMFRFLFDKSPGRIPTKAFHFEKTDLHRLSPDENVYVWMGHSSYFLQVDGLKVLVDPVFSGFASPFSFSTRSFSGSDLYSAEDIPELDVLVITHDHWDHLDYETVTKLFDKTKNIVTSLGTGEHLEHWGCDPSKIIELDWEESTDLGSGFTMTAEPARHFSGRGLQRDQALWASFLLKTPTQKIYIGGDSGYDAHFKKIGEKYQGIDLAILETGQYNEDWRYIHMMPGEELMAMKDLQAKRLIPVHNSKFALARHSWQEPLQKMAELNTENARVLYPKIGQKINWQDDAADYPHWWLALG